MQATDSFPAQPVTGESERPGTPGPEATLPEAAPRNESTGSNGIDATLEACGARAMRDGSESDRQSALRALRNLEATEARLTRNAKREVEETRGKLVQELLPVLDNLDRTIRAAHAARSEPALLEGVRMVRHQLESVLRGYGVERIEALDQRFDPSLHEAIGVAAVSDPRRHGVVVQQAEPGYKFAGRLLRPAKVSVGKLAAPPIESGHRPVWR